jgi:hypothetical protein
MMRVLSLLAFVGAGATAAMALLRRRGVAHKLGYEARKRTHLLEFVEHDHEAIVHEHEHYHVTHNRREGLDEMVGEWEHLTARHSHAHNHAALTHAHAGHENAEHEHQGEAHVHDHEHPTTS